MNVPPLHHHATQYAVSSSSLACYSAQALYLPHQAPSDCDMAGSRSGVVCEKCYNRHVAAPRAQERSTEPNGGSEEWAADGL